MGSKRFFEDGLFQEFPLKYPKLVNATEPYPCIEFPRKADIPVKGDGFHFENESKNMFSHSTEKEVEISVPYSWVTSSSSEEEGVSSSWARSSSQHNTQFEETNTYASSIYGTPAIQILLGPDHQAELPKWDPQHAKKRWFGYDQLRGDCVISVPGQESRAQIKTRAGKGRKSCGCFDKGSATCVQQHVKEARARLRADIGPEKFVKLGFCDMGDDVSQLWTVEEERVFHEVVYSNPVSHKKNFWDNLSSMFPSRTKKEIVSYYFNVFVLRRRSVQNRSNFLEVDSDDDEWNVGYWEHVECSANESPKIEEANYEEDLPVVNEVEKNDDGCKDGVSDCKDGVSESCARSSADGFESSYLMESSHVKVWDDSFQMSPMRFNEFLSTGQMIEELFGSSPDSGSMF